MENDEPIKLTKNELIDVLCEGTYLREETISKLTEVINLLDGINIDQKESLDSLSYFINSTYCPKNVKLTLRAIQRTLSIQIDAVSKLRNPNQQKDEI